MEESEKEKYNDRKFFAALSGIDLDKDSAGNSDDGIPSDGVQGSRGLFKDPKEYEHMSPEERKAETNRIKNAIRKMGFPIKESKVKKDG